VTSLNNDSLTGLPVLYGLRLASNGIRRLPGGMLAAVPTLQVLNLAHNEIEELHPDHLRELRKLQLLRLDSNKLRDVNGILQTQSELRWLNVSSNRLQWFDWANIPRSVRWLDLHGNVLDELANWYKLQGAEAGNMQLRTLDASGNRLHRLAALSLPPPRLEYVFLNDNQLEVVEAGALSGKNRLRRVDLSDNLLRNISLPALAVDPENGGMIRGAWDLLFRDGRQNDAQDDPTGYRNWRFPPNGRRESRRAEGGVGEEAPVVAVTGPDRFAASGAEIEFGETSDESPEAKGEVVNSSSSSSSVQPARARTDTPEAIN